MARDLKSALLRALARTRTLQPAFRAYEALRGASVRRGPAAPDGLPLPSPWLMVKVAGTPDAAWFLESGRRAAQSIRASLERHGRTIDELESLLDFGCGCGRVLRHWRGVRPAIHGTDGNRALVDWCRRNLPFGRFETNGLAPPLPYADESFDLVYALSVLTHLPEGLQLAWMSELRRVLRPGGHLVLTTHGARYRERLTPAELTAFDAGELVVRWPEAAGTNLCTVFHPEPYVRTTLARGFALEELLPEGAAGNPHQDLILLRRD